MSMNATDAVQASKDYSNIEPPKSLTEQAWAKSNLGVKITMVALATILLPLSAIFVGIDFLVKHFRVLSFNKENKGLISAVKNCQDILRSYKAEKAEKAAAIEIQRVFRGNLSRKPIVERQLERVVNEMARQTADDPAARVVITGELREDLKAVNVVLGDLGASGQIDKGEDSDGEYVSVPTTDNEEE